MGILKDILDTAVEVGLETPASILKEGIKTIFGDD